MDYRFTIPNFQSRLLDYMNYGLPVIAATVCNTDVGKVIEDNGFGWWCESRDPECYRSLLQSIFERKDVAEKLFEKSLAARKCLEKLYTTDRAYRTILEAASAGTAGAERTNVNE